MTTLETGGGAQFSGAPARAGIGKRASANAIAPAENSGALDYARRFVGAHGDKAELEAAQKAAECERQGQKPKPSTGAGFRRRSRRCAARI
jgi:hypothetical protein